MSNIIYGDSMYNPEIKEEFMSQFHKDASVVRRLIFRKSYKTETLLGKDLYDFNINDIDSLMIDFGATTTSTARIDFDIIKQYILWAISKGYRGNISPFDDIPNDYYEKFVKQNYDKFLTKDQFFDLLDHLANPQDQAVMYGLWEGIGGKGNLELAHIKKTDVDYENGIVHIDNIDGRKRDWYFTDMDFATKVFKEAAEQGEYYKSNGEMVTSSYMPNYTDLIENGYVIKPSNTNNKSDGPIASSVIQNKFNMIKKYFPDLKYLTPKSVMVSRYIYEGYLIYKKTGRITNRDLVDICRKFHLVRTINGKDQWNLPKLRDVNIETISKLYGIEEFAKVDNN